MAAASHEFKESDQATFKVTAKEGCNIQEPRREPLELPETDEISNFVNARYIGSSEAFWRIFHMPIHARFPPVFQLNFHLENGQHAFFTE